MSRSDAPAFLLGDIIAQHRDQILASYVQAQRETRALRLVAESELRRQGALILDHLQHGTNYDPHDSGFAALRQTLLELSQTWALQGFNPSETARFLFALKEVLLPYIQQVPGRDPGELVRQVQEVNRLLDGFSLLTFDTYVQGREAMLREQSQAILELSTPVVQVWEGILALPLVGAVDTARTQQIMEELLTRIVERAASVVIIDITGVPIVDTAVARHLLQTVAAARLLGAESVIVGISARIAQTLVHLGVDLSEVITRATLAKGLEYALARTGQRIVRVE